MRSREGQVVDMSIVSGEEDQEHEEVNGQVLDHDPDDELLVSEADEGDADPQDLLDEEDDLDQGEDQ
jgi:hypothetical protein